MVAMRQRHSIRSIRCQDKRTSLVHVIEPGVSNRSDENPNQSLLEHHHVVGNGSKSVLGLAAVLISDLSPL